MRIVNEPCVFLLSPVEKVLQIVDESGLIQNILLSERCQIIGIRQCLDELEFYLKSGAVDGLGVGRVVCHPRRLDESLNIRIVYIRGWIHRDNGGCEQGACCCALFVPLLMPIASRRASRCRACVAS